MKKWFSRGRILGVAALVAGVMPLVAMEPAAHATDCGTTSITLDFTPGRISTGQAILDAFVTIGGADDGGEKVAFTTDGDGNFSGGGSPGATIGPPSNGTDPSNPNAPETPGHYWTLMNLGSSTSQHVTATILPSASGTATPCATTAVVTSFGPTTTITVSNPGAVPAKPKPGQSNTSSVTATVTDSNNSPVVGETVTFDAPSPPGNGVTFGGNPHQPQNMSTYSDKTDAKGQVTAPVKGGSLVGKITIRATGASGKSGINFLVQYGDPAHTAGSVAPTSIPADGATQTTATAAVTDTAGDAVPGATVTVFANDNDVKVGTSAGPAESGTTDANGQVVKKITSSKQVHDVIVNFVTDGDGSDQKTYTQTQPANTTALTLNPGTVPADGKSTSTATATVVDSAKNPVSGVTITFSTNGDSTINPKSATTGADGKASTTITASTTADKETITATGSNGQSGSATLVETAVQSASHGYWFVASDGGIFNYGDAQFYGSEGGSSIPAPIVGVAATADRKGYWLAGADGSVYVHGDATFQGSLTGQHLNKPIVGIAGTPSGRGYWMVASDGGIFAYGDAQFLGSAGGAPLNKPVVGMTAATDGNGYWLVASDGGIFNYGPSSSFKGSAGSLTLNSPVVGMATAPDGSGYWLVAADGGIFTYGPKFYGSMGGQPLNQPVVGMAAAADNSGYWLVASDGGIFSFGPPFEGSAGGSKLNKPINGMSGF